MNVRTKLALFGIAALAVIAAVVLALRRDETSPPSQAEPPRVVATAPPAPDAVAPPNREETVAAPPRLVRKEQQYVATPTNPDETLWGHVTDAISKQPIDFFHTYLMSVEAGDIVELASKPENRRIFGNDRGAFTYRELAKGKYNLLVRRDGFRDAIVRDIEVPNKHGLYEIALQRGAYIDVTVIDGLEGEGEGGVEVQIQAVSLDDPKAPRPTVQMQQTDDFGKTVFTGIPPGTWSVFLTNKALSSQGPQQIYVGPEVGVPVQFIVQPLNTLNVTVKDPKGETLNAVHVRMWVKEAHGGSPGTWHDETDNEGEAVLTHVPAGTYVVKIWKNGFFRQDKDVTITAPEGETAIEFVMDPDPLADKGGSEANPTLEQIQKLKTPGVRPADVFTKKKG